jgi:hypothetical protein
VRSGAAEAAAFLFSAWWGVDEVFAGCLGEVVVMGRAEPLDAN